MIQYRPVSAGAATVQRCSSWCVAIQMTNQGKERRHGAHGPISAFETIGLASLTTTGELRVVNERARIQQAVGSPGETDATASTIERLLRDPTYRLREVAAWYFAFSTDSEAAEAEERTLLPHDRVLMRWRRIAADAAGGEYSPEAFEETCTATAQLLNNPPAWQPLDALVRDIADVRVDSGAVVVAAAIAAERWTCAALLAIAAAGDADVLDAAETAIAQDFPDEVVHAIKASVLGRAAHELTDAAAETESRVEPLLKQIEKDRSVAGPLGAAAEELVAAARPWWALADAFDDDPDSGEEGRALDRVAGLLHGIAVSLVNNADDFRRAKRLLGFAREIAQSSSVKSRLELDLTKVSYLGAHADAVEALQAHDIGRAAAHLREVHRHAATAEDRAQAAQLQLLVQQLRSSGPGQPQYTGAARGGRIPWKTLASLAVVAAIVIAGAVNSARDSGGDSPGSSGGGIAPSGDIPISDASSGNSSGSSEVEQLAIERERSRLAGIESELEDLAAQIDRLARNLDSTEAQYPDGAPQYIIDQYNADVRRHNALLAQYDDTFADYESDLAAFNRRVDAYNSSR